MKYDFDEIIPRRGTNSVKWDLATDERVLPMWVADMDFRAAPPVLDALERRLRHGVFGYTKVPDAYFEAVKGWFGKRHGFRIENEWILPTTGVIPALSVILKALTEPGDKVILQTPVYNCFFAVLERTGRQPLANPLIDEGGAYRMDFEDLERKAADPQAKLIFLCNPHNPGGRVWSPEELRRVAEICTANGTLVVSDEIHADLTLPGRRHTVFATVSEQARMNSVTYMAPSKTFNLAGLVGSYHIIYNPMLRDRIVAKGSKSHYNEMNVLSMHALIGAYKPEGHEWLDELKEVLTGNVDYAYDYITKHFQGVSLAKPEGTYMLLLDCEQWCKAHGLTLAELEKRGWDVGVDWQDGSMFQAPYSIRVNLALPLSRIKEAMRRLDQYVFNA